jgi:hypothetical protein
MGFLVVMLFEWIDLQSPGLPTRAMSADPGRARNGFWNDCCVWQSSSKPSGPPGPDKQASSSSSTATPGWVGQPSNGCRTKSKKKRGKKEKKLSSRSTTQSLG